MTVYKNCPEEESSLYGDALRRIFFSIVNFACVRRNNWEFSSNFFSLKITKVSKVFINNIFLGIKIYYINILFGLFDIFGANNWHMFWPIFRVTAHGRKLVSIYDVVVYSWKYRKSKKIIPVHRREVILSNDTKKSKTTLKPRS
jgi:hypothetical protein